MPSAHEHNPEFAMSPDRSLLVAAERDEKRIRSSSMIHLFLYCLPKDTKRAVILDEAGAGRRNRRATLMKFLEG